MSEQALGDRLRAVLTPVVTPFDRRTGDLDRDAFEENVRAHLAAGVSGIVVSGSTGEAALLDENERQSLVRWSRAVVPSDRVLIAGAGSESTRSSVRLARQAADEGADAVIVVAPHYYGESAMTSDALIAHYARIADESPVAVVLYNIPRYMHYALPPAVVHELARHENVVAIKDSSGDLGLLEGYLVAQSDRFHVLTGHGGSFASALRLGARGGILAVSAFAADLSLGIYDTFVRGDGARLDAAQQRLAPLASEIVGRLGVAGVKAALDQMGMAGGPPRLPLLPLSASQRQHVADLLRDAELLVAA